MDKSSSQLVEELCSIKGNVNKALGVSTWQLAGIQRIKITPAHVLGGFCIRKAHVPQ